MLVAFRACHLCVLADGAQLVGDYAHHRLLVKLSAEAYEESRHWSGQEAFAMSRPRRVPDP